jgi:hypothetical protein
VTITLFLSKGSLETRLLIVSLARAIMPGDIGKKCGSVMVRVIPDCYHATRINNRIWEQRISSGFVILKD